MKLRGRGVGFVSFKPGWKREGVIDEQSGEAEEEEEIGEGIDKSEMEELVPECS